MRVRISRALEQISGRDTGNTCSRVTSVLQHYYMGVFSDSLVPSSPTLTSLPEYFTRWEALARKLPALISERRIREGVHALSPLEMGTHQPRANTYATAITVYGTFYI